MATLERNTGLEDRIELEDRVTAVDGRSRTEWIQGHSITFEGTFHLLYDYDESRVRISSL